MGNLKINKIVGFLILVALLFAVGYLIPYTIVLGKGGILQKDISEKLGIYSDILFFAVPLIVLYVANYLWKRNNEYGDSIGVYNKEETIFKNFTYPQLTLASFILFGWLFFLVNTFKFLGSGVFGLKVLPQQFTPIDSLLVSTSQIPIAEEFMSAFTLGLICLILTIVAIKLKWNKKQFKWYRLGIVIFLMSAFGFIWHKTAYPTSDVAGLVVALFWGLKAFLSLITGFFMVALALHMNNNFFIDFSRLFTSDIVLISTSIALMGLTFLYYWIYKGRLFGKKPIKLEI